MTTRRIGKKHRRRSWLDVVGEVIGAVEQFTGRKSLNGRAVVKTAGEFLCGEGNHFITMPLSLEGVQSGRIHFIFERWPLKATLRTDKGLLDAKALATEFEKRCGSHREVEVSFREVGYEEMKRELVSKRPRVNLEI